MNDRWAYFRNPVIWTAAALLLGLTLRSFHYLRCPSVWHDEAALIVNVIGKDYAEMFGPLHLTEAAPPFFLIVQKAVTQLLGDGPCALRLLPFLASCLTLLLLVPLARRLLPPAAVPWAVLLLACSDRLLWHSCEAKPYAVDVLLAVVLANIYFAAAARPLVRLLLFAGLAPLTIFLSYPACFLYGGILLALLPGVWRQTSGRIWGGYALLVLAVFAAWLVLVTGPVAAQRCADMDSCWVRQFPDWQRPWSVPFWIMTSIFEAIRYCFLPLGQPLSLLALAGGIRLWRNGQRAAVIVLAVPFGLALVAALLGKYPFGAVRVIAYSTPALAILIAAGIGPVLAWLRARNRPTAAALLLLLFAPAALSAFRAVEPWARADCAAAAGHVLTNLQPGDAIVANHWEYLYYFRGCGAGFRYGVGPDEPGISLTSLGQTAYHLQGLPFPETRRLWLIWTNQTRSESVALEELNLALEYMNSLQGWRPVSNQAFQFTRVVYLERD